MDKIWVLLLIPPCLDFVYLLSSFYIRVICLISSNSQHNFTLVLKEPFLCPIYCFTSGLNLSLQGWVRYILLLVLLVLLFLDVERIWILQSSLDFITGFAIYLAKTLVELLLWDPSIHSSSIIPEALLSSCSYLLPFLHSYVEV